MLFAQGIEYFLNNFFAQIFDPSKLEADLVGPNIVSLFFLNSSTIPSIKGASGPTIVREILFCLANFIDS